jgi:hypothetical protein
MDSATSMSRFLCFDVKCRLIEKGVDRPKRGRKPRKEVNETSDQPNATTPTPLKRRARQKAEKLDAGRLDTLAPHLQLPTLTIEEPGASCKKSTRSATRKKSQSTGMIGSLAAPNPPQIYLSDASGQPQNVLAREILQNLQKFPHCLLLTRVGQFYEVRIPSPHARILPLTKGLVLL